MKLVALPTIKLLNETSQRYILLHSINDHRTLYCRTWSTNVSQKYEEMLTLNTFYPYKVQILHQPQEEINFVKQVGFYQYQNKILHHSWFSYEWTFSLIGALANKVVDIGPMEIRDCLGNVIHRIYRKWYKQVLLKKQLLDHFSS